MGGLCGLGQKFCRIVKLLDVEVKVMPPRGVSPLVLFLFELIGEIEYGGTSGLKPRGDLVTYDGK